MEEQNKTDQDNKPAEGEAPAAAEAVSVSRLEYEALLAKSKEAEELKDSQLRARADFENAKKRLLKEKEDFVRFAGMHFMTGILPVVDNLERALEHAQKDGVGQESPLFAGVNLVKKQLLDFLKSEGLEKLETGDKLFDPHVHEAVAFTESEDAAEETVLEEYQGGYLLKGKLLRPARVRVAKPKGKA